MKKVLIPLLFSLTCGVAQAANFVSTTLVHVNDLKSGAVDQTVQSFRAGKDVGDLTYGLHVRTVRFDGGGLNNIIETTVTKSFIKGLDTFAGIAYNNGKNGIVGKDYMYGIVGASTGTKIGPMSVNAGVLTRVNWEDINPSQVVGSLGVSYPLTNKTAINLGVSRSWLDIQEKAVAVGLRFNY